MDLNLFSYSYPKSLIAQHPLPERDLSRMMVINRSQKSCEHKSIQDLPDILRASDLLIFNDTKVFPARLMGEDESGKTIEILLLNQKGNGWNCLGKPLKRIKVGMEIYFAENFSGTITKKENGFLEIEFHAENLREQLEKIGLPPLPPYIKRKTALDYSKEDKERYQSLFAKNDGSAAAPTASLHFSEALLKKIAAKNIEAAFVTLHVSTDTFLPIRAEKIADHKMHGENFFVPKETREKIARAKKEKRRVIAVGTTAVRALESDWSKETTHLFITPGFKFKIVDAMLTNFHQPESTLLVLVSAFAGRELILRAYTEAMEQKYRLFSYGDCMLVV